MTALARRLWLLRKAPLLAELDLESVTALAEVAELQAVERHKVVYLEGDPSRHLVLVHGGRVKTFRSARPGRTIALAVHRAGGFFGELCLVGEQSRAEAAVAVAPSHLSLIPREALQALAGTNPQIAARLLAVFARQRQVLERRLVGTLRTAPGRVAELLLENAESVADVDGTTALLAAGLSQTDLAELLGMRRESMSVVLRDLERDGLIRRRGNRGLLLTDPARLGTLAGVMEEYR